MLCRTVMRSVQDHCDALMWSAVCNSPAVTQVLLDARMDPNNISQVFLLPCLCCCIYKLHIVYVARLEDLAGPDWQVLGSGLNGVAVRLAGHQP